MITVWLHEEMKELRKIEAEEFRASSIESAKHYGYPQCCVDAFVAESPSEMRSRAVTEDDRKRGQAALVDGTYSGFVPCKEHAEKIIAGELQLADLIKDRDETLQPFPNDWSLK